MLSINCFKSYFLSLVTAACLLCLPFQGFAQDQILSSPLVVSIPANFPPHYYLDDNNHPTGFAIDVFDVVAAKAGLEYRYEPVANWIDVWDSIREGKTDIVPNVGISEERMQFLDFTSPVETFSVSVFVRASNVEIENKEDLRGRKVAVIRENIGVKLAEQMNGVRPVLFSDVVIGFYALVSGQVDALIYPEPVVWNMARNLELTDNIKSLSPGLKEIKRAIGVRKGLEGVQAPLEEALHQLVNSEQYNQIYQKWFYGKKTFWDQSNLMIITFVTISFLIFLILILLLRLRKLSRKNTWLITQLKLKVT